LKFLESPQLKLDKDPFLMNMNMIELDGKKVLIWPSQAESTKGKDVIVGEERPPRMIKPRSPKGDQWQKNEGGKPQQCPKATFDILIAKYKEGRTGIRGHENRTIQNTKLDSPVSLGQVRAGVRGREIQTIQNAKSDSLVSLGQANTSTTEGSSGKWSRTPPW
jgi:hypothetical protein